MGVVSGCRGAGSQSRWGAGTCAGTEAGSCSRCGLWDGLSRKPHSHIPSGATRHIPGGWARATFKCEPVAYLLGDTLGSVCVSVLLQCSASKPRKEAARRPGGRRPFSAADGSLPSCPSHGLPQITSSAPIPGASGWLHVWHGVEPGMFAILGAWSVSELRLWPEL